MATTPTAFITGANRGLGYETSRQLAQKGFKIFAGVRDPEHSKSAFDILKAENLDVTPVRIDTSDHDSIVAAAQELSKLTAHLDVLINNAAIYADGDAGILETTPAVLEQTFRTNVFGPLYVVQALSSLLRKSSNPRVVNVSSGMGSLSEPMGAMAPAYSLSKTALNGVTRQLHAALSADRIKVYSVCPGWVRTDMGGPNAHRSVEQGVETIVWLAEAAPKDLAGLFVRDRKPISW